MSKAKKEAQDLLVYYIRLLAVNHDLVWNEDNEKEIKRIVDLILEAVKE